MAEYSPELVERAFNLARKADDFYSKGSGADAALTGYALTLMREAHSIVAELPKPVDPDLIEARKIAAANDIMGDWREDCLAGRCDDQAVVRCSLDGIKRGRELAEQPR